MRVISDLQVCWLQPCLGGNLYPPLPSTHCAPHDGSDTQLSAPSGGEAAPASHTHTPPLYHSSLDPLCESGIRGLIP